MGYAIPNFIWYFLPSVLILFSIRKYRESKWGKCRNKVSLQNKLAIVTGANSGIGYEVTKELVKRGAYVIMACRNFDSCILAMDKIEKETKLRNKMIYMKLDLASLQSIKAFVEQVKEKFNAINILVNNAGVSYPDGSTVLTNDGYEVHFGVNHLGHFYLTNLLIEKLENGQPSRIVIISSRLYQKGLIDFDALGKPGAKNLYANSKLANIYFCKELARVTKGRGVSVYSVCPGWVYTSLFRHHKWGLLKYFLLIIPVAFIFMRTPKQGSQTVIYCATEPGIENDTGGFYRDCEKFETKTPLCEHVSHNLWDASVKMIEDKGFQLK